MKEIIVKIDECKNMDIQNVEASAVPFNESNGKYVDVRVRIVIKIGEW